MRGLPDRPLIWLALAFGAGVAVAEAACGRDLPVPALSPALVAVACAGLGAWALCATSPRRPAMAGLAALIVTGGALGALDLVRARRALGPVRQVTRAARPIDVEGVVAAPVSRVAGRVAVAVDLPGGRRVELRAAPLPGIDPDGCRFDVGAASLLPGDRVRTRATVVTPIGFADPGAEDERRALGGEGIFAIAHVPGGCGGVVRLAGPPEGGGVLRDAAAVRLAADGVLHRLLGDGQGEALVAAMTLGDRGDVDEETLDAFRDAGATHLVRVAGLHLALVGALVFLLVRAAGARSGWLADRMDVARPASAAAAIAVLGYAAVAGASGSTERAALAAAVALAGRALGRRPEPWTTLAAAALAILVPSPLALFQPWLALSFAALAGMLAWSEALVPDRWRGGAADDAGLGRRAASRAIHLAAAAVSAFLATAPLAAWQLHAYAPGALGCGLLVAPVVELVVVPAGLAGTLAGALVAPLGRPLLGLAAHAALIAACAVRVLAGLSPARPLPGPPLAAVLAFYLAVTLWLRPPAGARGRRRARRVAMVAAVACVGSVAVGMAARWASRDLRITFLDVGQGDAAIVELPGGATWVIDGGGSTDPAFDPGARMVGPALAALGATGLERIWLSHPHPDHMNGLVSLIARWHPVELLDAGGDPRDPGYARLLAALDASRVPRRLPSSGTFHGVRVEVLAPRDASGRIAPDATAGPNDNSVVLRLDYGGRSVLFAGDVEAAAEERLVEGGADLSADVLKVPHHGSRTSSTPAFLAAVRPRLAVISCGRGNRYGFPHAEVLARYRARGVRLLRTDLDGAVTVTIAEDGTLTVSTFAAGEIPSVAALLR